MTIEFLIKGAHFRGKDIKQLVEALDIGTLLTIEREPDNEHDEYACKVLYEDIHVGYVEKDMAPSVSFYAMDEPLAAKIVGREHIGRNTYPVATLAHAETGGWDERNEV